MIKEGFENRFSKGDIVYWCEREGGKYTVRFGVVEDQYSDGVYINFLELRERRRIDGIPLDEFRKTCHLAKYKKQTDTTIYSFSKAIQLLSNCNPNTIELLGFPENEYLHLSNLGCLLWANRHVFLSKRCIHTFGGYAIGQLRRLQNKAARLVGQSENEKYILNSIKNAEYDFKQRYFPMTDGSIKLYVDEAVNPEYESEIFMDINLKGYPLRDYAGMWNEMKCIVSSYSKNSKRNETAIEKGKLGKHMMHLIRLYMMCIDILEKEEIITRRTAEHDLLMDIRNGKYLDSNRQPTSEFYDILNEYEKRFEYAKNNTSLPDKPNYKGIEEIQIVANKIIVSREDE